MQAMQAQQQQQAMMYANPQAQAYMQVRDASVPSTSALAAAPLPSPPSSATSSRPQRHASPLASLQNMNMMYAQQSGGPQYMQGGMRPPFQQGQYPGQPMGRGVPMGMSPYGPMPGQAVGRGGGMYGQPNAPMYGAPGAPPGAPGAPGGAPPASQGARPMQNPNSQYRSGGGGAAQPMSGGGSAVPISGAPQQPPAQPPKPKSKAILIVDPESGNVVDVPQPKPKPAPPVAAPSAAPAVVMTNLDGSAPPPPGAPPGAPPPGNPPAVPPPEYPPPLALQICNTLQVEVENKCEWFIEAWTASDGTPTDCSQNCYNVLEEFSNCAHEEHYTNFTVMMNQCWVLNQPYGPPPLHTPSKPPSPPTAPFPPKTPCEVPWNQRERLEPPPGTGWRGSTLGTDKLELGGTFSDLQDPEEYEWKYGVRAPTPLTRAPPALALHRTSPARGGKAHTADHIE